MTPQQRKVNYEAAIASSQAFENGNRLCMSSDNPVFHLPGDQDKLIADVAAVNPNTVVVLNVTQPIAMPWLGKVKSVLHKCGFLGMKVDGLLLICYLAGRVRRAGSPLPGHKISVKV